MTYLNFVSVIGNLTRNPEVRYTKSGTPVCEFGIAMNKKTKTQSGEERSEVTFVEIVSIGKSAEPLPRYIFKGSAVLITGSLKYEQWKDRQGESRSRVIIQADRIQFLTPPPHKEEDRPADPPQHRTPFVPTTQATVSTPSVPSDGIDDDIPF